MSPHVTFSCPVCQSVNGCTSVNRVDVTADYLDIGDLWLDQGCAELLELALSDQRLDCSFESYADICVMASILVVFALIENVLKGGG